MPETEKNWKSKVGNIMLIFSFTSLMWGGIAYLMEPHAEKFIMDVVNENKGESTKTGLSREMKVDKTDVIKELGKMYRDSKHRHDAQDSILTKWIPYLLEETRWMAVGYFVSIDDPELVKFHHWNGRNYDAWKDDQGWYYVKGGFKHYK